ncbi:MAG: putative DNA binding domain-containing protein [Anaerolineales bacterium]|nr:putative DNA binding domain-containing protein [Anaerolineales bacterium]
MHLHSPASRDYEEQRITYLDWLRRVVERGLEMVAITDHNTVAGIGAIRRELEWLTRLEEQGRLNPQEQQRLDEWRELGNRVVVLPGFEFTATFGFHILGIFPPETSIRHLEHVLLDLKVPPAKLDEGSTETGATTDVLTAYRIIRAAGGLVIAAHANSTHGVAMRNFPFGGQTKIAYTQDANLDALEITDYERAGRSTVRFFNGSKPEYPRRMHCLQGSDAHRLVMDPKNPKRLGIGDRATELLLDEPTFDALAELLRSKQFDRVRPAQPADRFFDPLDVLREEGATLVQSFHETAAERGGKLALVVADVCAFANTVGGAVYIGCKAGKGKIKGLLDAPEVERLVRNALEERLTPPLEVKIETIESQKAKVVRIQVPKGPDLPYALDGNKFYVRDEAETDLAVRDEIVALVKEALGYEETEGGDEAGAMQPITPLDTEPVAIGSIMPDEGAAISGDDARAKRTRRRRPRASNGSTAPAQAAPATGAAKTRENKSTGAAPVIRIPAAKRTPSKPTPAKRIAAEKTDTVFYLPQVGVEIVSSEERGGHYAHTIRDLRNGHVIQNVTRKGARKLWSYAIEQREDHPLEPSQVEWQGDVGLVRAEKRAGKVRYDLALRNGDDIRVFYGVTDDGMEGAWSAFIADE